MLFYLLQAVTFTRVNCAWKFQNFCHSSRRACTVWHCVHHCSHHWGCTLPILQVTALPWNTTCPLLAWLLELQSFPWGFWHPWVCLFGGLRCKALLVTKESFNCTASWWHVFLTWWLLTQAQADGHLFLFLWTFPLFHFQNLIKANFWDIPYLSAISHQLLVAVCIEHKN